GIQLTPKEKLDIPVLFMPDTMKMYEAVVLIHVMRENGENWPYEDSAELNKDLKSVIVSEDGGIQGILWTYPVHGIPEAPHQKLAPEKSNVRENLEKKCWPVPVRFLSSETVLLNELVSSEVKQLLAFQEYDGGFSTMEFLYELQYQTTEIKSQLESLVGMHLIQRERDPESGIVTLTFNIVFAPNNPMRNEGTLVVQCTTGGIWKFPMLFVATEPEVDDVINIEAIGLNKESIVDFKLTSQTR
ncbi:CFA47 protein, partial [Alectura lathami]|nr:CFA47 protein [Alectura lathami]